MTPLSQRMVEDMAARNLGRHSHRSHLYSCERFAAFLERSPDTATADDIRRFLIHLLPKGFHRIRHYGRSPTARAPPCSIPHSAPRHRR